MIFSAKTGKMTRKLRNHRPPFDLKVNGTVVTVVTVGYLASAVNRSVSSVLRWERQGILPAALRFGPMRLRVYPLRFVEGISAAASRHLGARAEGPSGHQFCRAMFEVYCQELRPFVGYEAGVTAVGESGGARAPRPKA